MSTTPSIAGGSRFASTETNLRDPLTARTPTAAVARLGLHRQAAVVLPVTEASTLALLNESTVFGGVRIPTSDLDHFRRASDKESVLSLAHGLGIRFPPSGLCRSSPGEA